MLSNFLPCLGPLTEKKHWIDSIGRKIDEIRSHPENAFKSYSPEWANLSKLEVAAKLKKIQGCGNVVELRAPASGGPVSVHNYQKCGQIAVCPVCAGRSSAMRQKKLNPALEKLAELVGKPGKIKKRSIWPIDEFEAVNGLKCYMVTATMRPRETLKAGLDDLRDAWRKFQRMGQTRGKKKSYGEWSKVYGAIAKTEIKRGSGSGLWHAHIHALVFCNEPLDYRTFSGPQLFFSDVSGADKETGEVKDILLSKISLEWLMATDGDSYNIQCDDLEKYYRKNHKPKGIAFPESIKIQAKEVLKYATKWNGDVASDSKDFEMSDYVEVLATTYCRRLYSSYGCFRRIAGSDYVGNEDGQDLVWGSPGKPNPKIFSATWGDGGYHDAKCRPMPVFMDSDPTYPFFNLFVYGSDGILKIMPNFRKKYQVAIAKVLGGWKRERGHVIKLRKKERRYLPGRATERIFNSIRKKAKVGLESAREEINQLYTDYVVPAGIQRKIDENYRRTCEYHERVIASFLVVLQG